jgi:hypothetical protein
MHLLCDVVCPLHRLSYRQRQVESAGEGVSGGIRHADVAPNRDDVGDADLNEGLEGRGAYGEGGGEGSEVSERAYLDQEGHGQGSEGRTLRRTAMTWGTPTSTNA